METKFYYIHGLNGSKLSRKFLELQITYTNIECLEWNINDNISEKLNDWKQLIIENNSSYNCIIASSTGANFASQLKDIIKSKCIYFVLINPLFDCDYLFENSIMLIQLNKYIKPIKNLKESIILISEKDEVINNVKFLENNNSLKSNNHVFYDKNNSHRFENINHYYKIIDKLLNSFHKKIKIGNKVKFISSNIEQVEWGNNDDPNLLLDKNIIYEVEKTEEHSYHTKLYLKGIDGKFNSSSFEKLENIN